MPTQVIRIERDTYLALKADAKERGFTLMGYVRFLTFVKGRRMTWTPRRTR